MSKLTDICYRMYETSGNSKYIRAEWSGRPYHPDQAEADIKALFLELIGGDNYAPTGDQRAVEATNRRLQSIRKKVEQL